MSSYLLDDLALQSPGIGLDLDPSKYSELVAKANMATQRSPVRKVKLLVGPTCKIALNSKELGK